MQTNQEQNSVEDIFASSFIKTTVKITKINGVIKYEPENFFNGFTEKIKNLWIKEFETKLEGKDVIYMHNFIQNENALNARGKEIKHEKKDFAVFTEDENYQVYDKKLQYAENLVKVKNMIENDSNFQKQYETIEEFINQIAVKRQNGQETNPLENKVSALIQKINKESGLYTSCTPLSLPVGLSVKRGNKGHDNKGLNYDGLAYTKNEQIKPEALNETKVWKPTKASSESIIAHGIHFGVHEQGSQEEIKGIRYFAVSGETAPTWKNKLTTGVSFTKDNKYFLPNDIERKQNTGDILLAIAGLGKLSPKIRTFIYKGQEIKGSKWDDFNLPYGARRALRMDENSEKLLKYIQNKYGEIENRKILTKHSQLNISNAARLSAYLCFAGEGDPNGLNFYFHTPSNMFKKLDNDVFPFFDYTALSNKIMSEVFKGLENTNYTPDNYTPDQKKFLNEFCKAWFDMKEYLKNNIESCPDWQSAWKRRLPNDKSQDMIPDIKNNSNVKKFIPILSNAIEDFQKNQIDTGNYKPLASAKMSFPSISR
jgi:hypothetical protein